jgi:predicted methyltransferase
LHRGRRARLPCTTSLARNLDKVDRKYDGDEPPGPRRHLAVDAGRAMPGATVVPAASMRPPPSAAKFAAKLKADPAVYGHIAKVIPFAPPEQVKLGADNSADMVLTFRNTHDWLNHSPATLAAVFQAAFKVLKPGGVFGVTEHRAKPVADGVESAGALHRLPEDYLIALALKTGFRVAGVSQINANPNDPEDVNVHRLPPDLSGPDSEHAQMKAIGESDRMTLKFVKP